MKTCLIVTGIFLAVALSTGAIARDFSALSNQQLLELHIDQMSEVERQAFRSEVRSRMHSLDASERQQIRERIAGKADAGGEDCSHGVHAADDVRHGGQQAQGKGRGQQRGKGRGG